MNILFLSYINRSGSTYLANLLGGSDNICSLPEAEVIIKHLLLHPLSHIRKKDIKYLSLRLLDNPKLKNWNIGNEEISEILANAIGKISFSIFMELVRIYIERNKPQADFALFKGTELLKAYSLNHDFFYQNNIQLITILRDGRAAYASQKSSLGSLTGLPMSTNVITTAIQWKEFAIKKSSTISIDIKYEDLVLNPAATLKLVSNNIHASGIGFKDIPAKNGIKIPDEQKHLHRNIYNPPDTNRINGWRDELTAEEINCFEMIAKNTLMNNGYQCESKLTLHTFFLFFKLYTLHWYRIIIFKIPMQIKATVRRAIYNSKYA